MIDSRDRMTEGMNRARLHLEVSRALPSLPVILVGFVFFVLGGLLIFSQLTPTLFKSTRELRVAIDDAYGVLEGVDDVRYRGVPAGTIKKIERDGTQLVLRVSLRKDYPVYEDARAELRPQTPLNDQYLDIVDPGTRGAGELTADEVLPESRTEVNVKINDVLNTLRSNERTRLALLLDNLGNGLEDGGEGLKAGLEVFVPFLQNARQITDEVARRDRLTRRLVANSGELMTELGRREREIRTLVRDGSATLGTLQEGSSDLNATLAELPPTVGQVRTSFTALNGVLGDVDRVVGDLGPVADQLPSALRSVRKLTAELGPAAKELQKPVTRLAPFALALRPVVADLDATAAQLVRDVPSIDYITKSIAACEKGIIGFFQWNSSLTKFGDVRGPVPRGTLAVETPDAGIAGVPRRKPKRNCAGGTTLQGRVPTEKDLR